MHLFGSKASLLIQPEVGWYNVATEPAEGLTPTAKAAAVLGLTREGEMAKDDGLRKLSVYDTVSKYMRLEAMVQRKTSCNVQGSDRGTQKNDLCKDCPLIKEYTNKETVCLLLDQLDNYIEIV